MLLWKERFFFKPKSFEQIYNEITHPSKTSADISLEKRTLDIALRKLVKKGILVRTGSMFNEEYSQGKEPPE
jgi:DNA-binding HxlR family transcriptional regulator